MEYLRQIEADIVSLGNETRKRYPEVKEAADRALSSLKNIRGRRTRIHGLILVFSNFVPSRNVCLRYDEEVEFAFCSKQEKVELSSVFRYHFAVYACMQLCRCKSEIGTSTYHRYSH